MNDTQWDEKLLRDPHHVADKRTRVQKMFSAIAPSYDINNRLHSLGMDQRWRKKAVKLSQLKHSDVVVDVACGTGDLTEKFAQQLELLADIPETVAHVIGIDFTFEMLPIARRKRLAVPSVVEHASEEFNQPEIARMVQWINGDAQALPLPDQCCDVVSIAFGIRNVQDVPTALKEFNRVLRPGGRVIILEFSLPSNAILRGMYNFYFRQILPRTATLISGDKTGAYKYLPESVNTFISPSEMMTMMRAAGFNQVEEFAMTFGVCICYRGMKGESGNV